MPSFIQNDYEGYSKLIDLYSETKEVVSENVVLNFSKVEKFESNLLSVLGAIIFNLTRNANNVNLTFDNASKRQVQEMFIENKFPYVSQLEKTQSSGDSVNDTAISYRVFGQKASQQVNEYLNSELLSKKELPKMSYLLLKEIRKNILEIFSNAGAHGGNEIPFVFSCGQYFRDKQRLDFTVVNCGISIKKNVEDFLGKPCSGVETIEWALASGNTTRKGDIPGGLGMSLLREFLAEKNNNGKLQIASADGYYAESEGKIDTKTFSSQFDGTIVNIEFNMSDNKNYILAAEKSE